MAAAAPITSPCEHGGTILAPSMPTVIVGEMPAAGLASFHVCPSFTGPVPHVGGPVIAAIAATVIVGEVPHAVEGDMAICVGPPDSVSGSTAPTVDMG